MLEHQKDFMATLHTMSFASSRICMSLRSFIPFYDGHNQIICMSESIRTCGVFPKTKANPSSSELFYIQILKFWLLDEKNGTDRGRVNRRICMCNLNASNSSPLLCMSKRYYILFGKFLTHHEFFQVYDSGCIFLSVWAFSENS